MCTNGFCENSKIINRVDDLRVWRDRRQMVLRTILVVER